jgi:two-component system response regulator PrrA
LPEGLGSLIQFDRLSINVLLADDDLNAREGLQKFLQLSGFDVLTAADGGVAMDLLATAAPDVIILDLELPVIDGWEVARRAKALHRDSRIVALTGRVSQSERASAVRAGCDLYIPKPCSPTRLVEQIQKLLAG